MQNAWGKRQQLYFEPKKSKSGAGGAFQEGTLLHQMEGSVGEWVGARENHQTPGSSVMGHGKEKGANRTPV